jgi:hypothetical protein
VKLVWQCSPSVVDVRHHLASSCLLTRELVEGSKCRVVIGRLRSSWRERLRGDVDRTAIMLATLSNVRRQYACWCAEYERGGELECGPEASRGALTGREHLRTSWRDGRAYKRTRRTCQIS